MKPLRPHRAPPCDDHHVPARHVLRGALGAAVFAGVAAVAVLGLPVAGQSVGAVSFSHAPSPAPAARDDLLAVLLTSRAPASASVAPTPDPDTPTAADRAAGILRRDVVEDGSGEFDVAPGSSPAPGPGEMHVLRVEVERDLPVDRERFAAFVLATLNDPRGWGHDGAMTFARTDGDAPVTVLLATPTTSARLCGDLDPHEQLSCRNGPNVVLTFPRWVNGTDEYAGNLTGYRQYLVNHEVGHALGHGHEPCPGDGSPAPVMQQQTLGLKGCVQNPWPYPDHSAEP
jgi:Protein of unknown function (DUF3152)